MESSESRHDRLTCPECGHENLPGAAFCAQCGTTLRVDQDSATEAPFDDAQATSVYVPIGQEPEGDDPPLWSPTPPRDPIIDVDPRQTSAISIEPRPEPGVGTAPTSVAGSATAPQRTESIRGFVLGTVAVLLIAAVVGLYIYSAWLSDSARDTIDGWLPWALVVS
jgi:hypothetical protein